MSTGERIRFFRKRDHMTQGELGEKMKFKNQSANIRIAQYEWNRRTPKQEVLEQLAEIFDVSPKALQNPDINSNIGLMHTLFTLEDTYGLIVTVLDGEVCLKQDVNHPEYSKALADDLMAWSNIKAKLNTGSITREEYDHWRYHYPEDREKKKVEGQYSLDDAEHSSSMVKEETALYSEEDILEILRLYRERK